MSPIIPNLNEEELIGEFMGLFAGDGSFYKTTTYKYCIRLHFNITEKEFANNLINCVLIKLFGKKPMISKQENRLNLCYYSKQIYKLINRYLAWDQNSRKTYSVRLVTRDHSPEFIIGFLRGCVDSDGYISPQKICFSTVSPRLAKDIDYFLNKLNFVHTTGLYKEKRQNRKDIYHIVLWKKEFNRFIELIKPKNM